MCVPKCRKQCVKMSETDASALECYDKCNTPCVSNCMGQPMDEEGLNKTTVNGTQYLDLKKTVQNATAEPPVNKTEEAVKKPAETPANDTNATVENPPEQDIPEEKVEKEEAPEVVENNIDAEMKLNVDFQFVKEHQEEFVKDFVDDIANSLNCSKDKVLVTGIESGSVIVKFVILNNAKKEDKTEETIPPAVLIKQLQQKAEDNEIRFAKIESLTRKPVVSEVTKAVVVGDASASKVHCRNCGQVSDVNAKK